MAQTHILGWTEDRVATLRKLWNEQELSASQIARSLGGVTRSAVIGKAGRLNLTPRGNKGPRGIRRNPSLARTTLPRRVPRAKPIALQQPARIAETWSAWRPPLRIDLLDLRGDTCRFPLGDPKSAGFCFCGLSKTGGRSYCDIHAAVVRSPAKLRVR